MQSKMIVSVVKWLTGDQTNPAIYTTKVYGLTFLAEAQSQMERAPAFLLRTQKN